MVLQYVVLTVCSPIITVFSTSGIKMLITIVWCLHCPILNKILNCITGYHAFLFGSFVATDFVSVDLARSIIISVFVENNLHILLFLLSIYIKQINKHNHLWIHNVQAPLRRVNKGDKYHIFDFDFWCLTPLSAIFQLYHGNQF